MFGGNPYSNEGFAIPSLDPKIYSKGLDEEVKANDISMVQELLKYPQFNQAEINPFVLRKLIEDKDLQLFELLLSTYRLPVTLLIYLQRVAEKTNQPNLAQRIGEVIDHSSL